jgi:hypothetical protein
VFFYIYVYIIIIKTQFKTMQQPATP